MNGQDKRTILLTGATGFVGRYVYDALVEAGWSVRCATRDVTSAQARWPERTWVQLDVSDPGSLGGAMERCKAALYMIHGMASHGDDFRSAEVRQAEAFSKEAAKAGLDRIVYLGGVAAPGDASEHLRSREEVGEALRAGDVLTVELRASMIVGDGSLSWLIVRDLAARLPVMILPSWLRSRTEPVSIDDITVALVRALDLELEYSTWFDVPGPDVLSGREILERTAAALGVHKPVMIQVPFLSPQLSSHWVRFVTRAKWSVAREVVVGLKTDLIAHDDRFWSLIGHRETQSFDEAARTALEAERERAPSRGPWSWVERALRLVGSLASERSSGPEPRGADGSMAGGRALAYGLVWLIGAWISTQIGIWLAIGTSAALLGVTALLLERRTLWGSGPPASSMILGAMVGLMMAVATLVLFEPVAGAFPSLRADVAALYAAFRSPGALIVVFLMPMVVVFEEVVWRGAIHNALARRMSLPWAVVAGAVLYSLAHIPIGSAALVVTALGAGLCWSALRAFSDSLPAVVVAHLMWNFVVLVIFQLTP
ncbi:MAG: CPBP family glutamic-type intramembrane protease [Gemmatimonadetes bacterium]|nr:CPBP family glutamic-type intramembrane protease [Gemmatimonadota bacterium]MDA1104113.1 CPBP family glutamic-type intramembrane protease [Gemmatimonadota bacterium]